MHTVAEAGSAKPLEQPLGRKGIHIEIVSMVKKLIIGEGCRKVKFYYWQKRIKKDKRNLALLKPRKNKKLFAYSVLVTNLDNDSVPIIDHYRDRASNNFDEIKTPLGWGGYNSRFKVMPIYLKNGCFNL